MPPPGARLTGDRNKRFFALERVSQMNCARDIEENGPRTSGGIHAPPQAPHPGIVEIRHEVHVATSAADRIPAGSFSARKGVESPSPGDETQCKHTSSEDRRAPRRLRASHFEPFFPLDPTFQPRNAILPQAFTRITTTESPITGIHAARVRSAHHQLPTSWWIDGPERTGNTGAYKCRCQAKMRHPVCSAAPAISQTY